MPDIKIKPKRGAPNHHEVFRDGVQIATVMFVRDRQFMKVVGSGSRRVEIKTAGWLRLNGSAKYEDLSHYVWWADVRRDLIERFSQDEVA